MILNNSYLYIFQFLININFIFGIEISNEFNILNKDNNNNVPQISFIQESINKYSLNTTFFQNGKYIKNSLTFDSFNFNIQCENQDVCNIYTKELETVTKYFTSTFGKLYSLI